MQAGFLKVQVMVGGMQEWKQAGFQTEKTLPDGRLLVIDQAHGLRLVETDGTSKPFGDLKTAGRDLTPEAVEQAPVGEDDVVHRGPVRSAEGGHGVRDLRGSSSPAAGPGDPISRNIFGAACRNRTDDLFITSESLYRLS